MSPTQPASPHPDPLDFGAPPPPAAWTGRVSEWPLWAQTGALAAFYVLAARVDAALFMFWGPGTPVWVPVAVALAALLLFGTRLWPGVTIGALVSDSLEILANAPETPLPKAAAMGLVIALGATSEVVAAVWLTRRAVKTLLPLEAPLSFLRFIVLTAGAAPVINATVGAAVIVLGGMVPPGRGPAVWLSWYLGDVAGIVLVTPLLLAWAHKPDRPPRRERGNAGELALYLVLLGGVLYLLFSGILGTASQPYLFLIVPFLAWMAFRFAARNVAAAVGLLCVGISLATVHGAGPLWQADPWRTHILLQAFLCVTGGASLFMASVISQHRQALAGLRRYALQLDQSRRQLLEQSAELRSARDEAGRASQMKSDFLATVSHEFRTPLNAVIGMSDLLLETPLSGEQREYAATIQTSGRALLALVNDILDMSRIEAGRLTVERVEFSLPELVREVVRELAPAAQERGLELIADCPEGGPSWFLGDPLRIRQVVANLGGNAVKFTERGRVSIQAEVRPAGEGTSLVRVRVVDTGIGIPKDKQPLIFEKFMQADASVTRRYGGTGLGLAISKRLVELMGGEIGLESEPGRGSEFWFELPLENAPPDSPLREHPARQAAPDGAVRVLAGLRVLVAEDNPVNQRVAEYLLKKLGCVVEIAEDGAAAVQRVREGSYDAVLMDCQMPGLDGYAATAEIRALGGDGRLPVIAMTASAMAGDRERCLAAGMDDYLTKPLDLRTLQAALERWAAPKPSGARQ